MINMNTDLKVKQKHCGYYVIFYIKYCTSIMYKPDLKFNEEGIGSP